MRKRVLQRKNTYPAAREYLRRVQKAKQRVEQLKEQLINLRMIVTDTSAKISSSHQSGGSGQNRFERLFAEIDAVEREIRAAEEEAAEIREEVWLTIRRITNPLAQRILILHYVQGMNWKEVTIEVGYSRTSMVRFRNRGYAEMEKILRNTERP